MLRIDHVVFPVWHAKASLAFYRDVMGFELLQSLSGPDWGGYPWLMMIFSPGDGREIVLVALKGAKKPKADGLAKDVRHIAFGATSTAALAKWRKKLTAARIDFWEESHGDRMSLYFADPNGVILEVTAPPAHAKGKTGRKALSHAEAWIAA
ncbi:MAG TPA: VOC family protein [Rhizomicrobium sp.]|jgi:catechol 2,3-dioxygenase-like lactoylglutathione lyase family enzyme